jgi:ribonuclease HI
MCVITKEEMQSGHKLWRISWWIGPRCSMSHPNRNPNIGQCTLMAPNSKEGLGARIVLTSSKGDQLKYVLQIHFRASNNVAEYEALVHGLKVAKEIGVHRIICYDDSDLVVQQCSGDWDAKDANMSSYRFHAHQVARFFEGCELNHLPRADNEAADTLSLVSARNSTQNSSRTFAKAVNQAKPGIRIHFCSGGKRCSDGH